MAQEGGVTEQLTDEERVYLAQGTSAPGRKALRIIDQLTEALKNCESISAYRADEVRRLDTRLGQGCAGAEYVSWLEARVKDFEKRVLLAERRYASGCTSESILEAFRD